MSNEYFAKIVWNSDSKNFQAGKYSREHTWFFDGGVEVKASSSPHVVPLPFSSENAVDPEEAFVASLSSCHMLWFLSIAAKKAFLLSLMKTSQLALWEGTVKERLQCFQ